MTQKVSPLATVNPSVVDDSRLQKVDARVSLLTYLRKLFERRHYIRAEARSGAFSTGRDTYLGRLWLLLDPILQVSVYVVVFGLILKTSRGIDNFVGFLTLGVIFFRFLARGISSGNDLVRRSKSVISTFDIPAVSAVLSVTYRHFMDNAIPAFVAVGISILLQPDKPLSWYLVFVPALYILIHLFNFGAACITAVATAQVPDFRSVVNLATRCLFFLSGVFFSVDRFETVPELQRIIELNPIYQFLQSVRSIVLDGELPPIEVWSYLAIWSAGLALIGFLIFWLTEERFKNAN